MRTLRHTLRTAGTLLTLLLIFAAYTPAQTLTTLHSFSGSPDGAGANQGVVIGPGGVLYGITKQGGASGNGTAFSLTPPASPGGAWTENVYSFPGGGGGVNPAGLAISKGGVLYGATMYGGTSGNGTVYLLEPPASPGGSWTETALHDFTGSPSDGANPFAGVTIGDSGLLYGTTAGGGTSGGGTVFAVTPPASAGGAWTEAVLHSFDCCSSDGNSPQATLAIGIGGGLYGTTAGGGTSNHGTVFSLTPPGSPGGAWTETVLYRFSGGNDGGDPLGSVVIGGGGVLYGTTRYGGTSNSGTVFSLTPPVSAGGAWTETVLLSFSGPSYYGGPFAGVVVGGGGVLYGTNCCGGTSSDGTVFALTPPASPGGSWTEAVLYSFSGGNDGASPQAGVVIGSGGVLYGTTAGGGNSGDGTVFSLGVPITLTFQGTGSGTVTPTGATTPTAFTNAQFSFVFTTDTTQITTFSSTFNTPCVTGATVAVAGMSGASSTGLQAQVNAPYINLSACTSSESTSIFGGTNASFAGYNLQSPIAPLALGDLGAGIYTPGVMTSFGSLRLTGVSAATFTVTTGASTAPGTILSISEGPTHDFLIIATGAVETSWTQTGTFSNVSIAAALANGPDQVFLTNKIGSAATAANVLASATLPITGQTSGAASLTTLFTGLNLGPGTYYLVVQGGDWDIVDGSETTTLAPGLTLGETNVSLAPNTFVPASNFSQAGHTGPFLKMSITGNPVAASTGALSVTNAASYLAGAPLAPGGIATGFGSFLLMAPSSAMGSPLPTSLSGLSVQFGSGLLAPLFYAYRGQVNFQVPWELAGQSQTSIAAVLNGQTGAAQTVNLAPFSPGIFAINDQGTGQGAILDSSYRLVDLSNPATAGSTYIQIYCTGLGEVTNQPASGALSPSGPLAQTITTPTVTIGNVPANVLFSGLAPGYVGLYQVNAQVPAAAPIGSAVPVVISLGGAASNSVTMAVNPPISTAIPVPTTIATGFDDALGSAYSQATNQLLVADAGDGVISAVTVSTHVTAALGTGYYAPQDIELSADGLHAYVTEAPGTLLKVSLSNLNRAAATVIASGLNGVGQIALDEAHGIAYVAESTAGQIDQINLTTGVKTVVAPVFHPRGVLVTQDGRFAYVSSDAGTIVRLDLFANTSTTIASGLNGPRYLIWADAGESVILFPQTGAVFKLDLTASPAAVTAIAGPTQRDPYSIAVLSPDQLLITCALAIGEVTLASAP